MKEDEQDDVVVDEGEERAEGKMLKLREELKACRQEKQEYMDGWQRSKADYVNLLKRVETDTEASEIKGKIKAIEMLLPAFDALERAKEHGELPPGFAAIVRQLETAFKTLGLEAVGSVGGAFDPAYHEALGQDKADSAETDNTITAVLEKGWKIGLPGQSDLVIRPAKVRVAHFASEK